MADVILHTAQQTAATIVPNCLIDRYMRDANGEYLKVYLYLLRHLQAAGSQVSISGIADALDLTEREVRRALEYWERMSLLRLERDAQNQLCGICLTFSGEASAPAVSAPAPAVSMPAGSTSTPASAAPAPAVTRPHLRMVSSSESVSSAGEADADSYVPNVPAGAPAKIGKGTWQPTLATQPVYSAEALAAAAENESVRMLVHVTELYLNRHLTHTDTDYILYWLDSEQGLGMSPELAEYVVEHCANAGHTDIHYINRVALSWHERGIRTVEEARERAESFRRIYTVVKKSLGIANRDLNDEERAAVDRWCTAYQFSDELIAEACHRTIAAISQPRFSYVSGILEKWNSAGVKSLADVQALDEARARETEQPARRSKKAAKPAGQFYQFQSGEYDFAAIEQALREN